MSLEGRIYYFACEFLWSIITFFHYLSEKVAPENIDGMYLQWSGKHEDLAEWALAEKFFPIEIEELAKSDEKELLSTTETFGDTLIFHWGDALRVAAMGAHQRHPSISESMWLYYYYCRFFRQVLTEFDYVVQNLDNSTAYQTHYQQQLKLFTDMATAIEQEWPFLNPQVNLDKATTKAIQTSLDTYGTKLGIEWRQAVYSAAGNLKLPDFVENTG